MILSLISTGIIVILVLYGGEKLEKEEINEYTDYDS